MLKRLHRKRTIWMAAPIVAAVFVLAAGSLIVRRAARAVHDSMARVAAAAEIRFTELQLDSGRSSPFEPVSAPAQFNSAVPFHSQLYACGPTGLFVYDAGGRLAARYTTGRELPAAPLVQLAAGTSAGGRAPELFIATRDEGFLVFNGRTFHQVLPETDAYRHVTTVLPLPTGRLLLGTRDKGVIAYDGRRLAPLHPSLAALHVTALAGDDTDLWIGTLGDGVVRLHAGQLDKPEGLPDPQVLSIATQGNRAWVGTALGVAEYRDGRFARLLGETLFARALAVYGNELAVGTEDQGVVRIPLDVQSGRARRRDLAREGDAPVHSLFVSAGALYAVTANRIDALRGGSRGWVEAITPQPGLLSDRNISALLAEPGGRLWVGFFDRGLDIVEAPGNRTAHIEDDHVFCVNRIVQDAERGVTAVATANGLVLFDRDARQRQVLGRRDGLIADHVTDVVLGRGSMTVATPAGLTFLDGGGARSIYAFQGLVNNHVYALGASGNRLLAGTLGGLSVLEAGVVRASYTVANTPLRHNWITAVTRVGDGWFIGTYGGGVLRLDAQGVWQTFPQARGFEVNPNAMLATRDHVFAGSLGRGLFVYNRAAGRWFAITAGLPSANVTALAESGGALYVGTDNGLVRVPENALN